MKNNDKYWLAFASIECIGSKFIQTLFEHFGDIEKAWSVKRSDINILGARFKNMADEFFSLRDKTSPDECLEYINNKNIKYITFEDENYPELLKQISNPPMVLFYKGDLSDCNLERTLAVVGSRRASESAKVNLRKLLLGFKNTDVVIVSGMAEGIDTVAHKSALEAGVKTIAVLGGGFDHIFPKSNVKLFNEIIDGHGAVLTEYWPTFQPMPFRFPVRNRIVSGLSKGTLVAEAALRSGALITANLTLEQNRELMCMPGVISNPNTEGIFKLLKNGAALITNTDDILDQFGWKIERAADNNSFDNQNLNDSEKLVLEEIKLNSLSFDELILKTNLNINDLMLILTQLEIKGLIQQTDGNKYLIR
ncbi:DNA-processing protein DprA [bacterium]|nr:DNA-processing protein DprA [bacterium]